jgi:ABC-type Fe3+ transport system substrate-binding protein
MSLSLLLANFKQGSPMVFHPLISLRTIFRGGAALWLAASLATAALPYGIAMAGQAAASSEEAQLDALYAEALSEGAAVTVYMGGDLPNQWPVIQDAFDKRFPNVKLSIVTDLSKYHGPRIENQLATRVLVPDVAVLQTTQDFERWKKEGVLLKYKPASWDKIFPFAKDPDGYWVGAFIAGFTPIVAKSALAGDPASFKASDLLQLQFKDKLIFTYPNDDDAVLFGFKLLVDKYGWDWLKGIAAQNPAFVRGTPYSSAGVASGKYLATLATAGDPGKDALPIAGNADPFNSWPQRAAIFKAAKHPAGAKLFYSWLVSAEGQKAAFASWTWPVREDVAPPMWLKPIKDYKNTDPTAYARFMSDRAAVELFRSQLELYFKPVSGVDPASPDHVLGLQPISN